MKYFNIIKGFILIERVHLPSSNLSFRVFDLSAVWKAEREKSIYGDDKAETILRLRRQGFGAARVVWATRDSSQTFSSLINKENNKLFNILQTILQLTQKPVLYFTYILFVFFASIFFYNNAVFLAFLTSEISFIRHIKKDGFFW